MHAIGLDSICQAIEKIINKYHLYFTNLIQVYEIIVAYDGWKPAIVLYIYTGKSFPKLKCSKLLPHKELSI